MLTLSKTTKETKLLLKWGGIIVGLFIILLILFKAGTALKNQFFPEPEPPPTVGFGKIEALVFPKSVISSSGINYTIDTVTGELPSFDDRAKVYKIIKPEPNILSLKKAQEKLAAVSFRGAPHALSDSLYQWTDSSEISRKISFDIYSSDFTMSSNFLNSKEVQIAKNIGNENTAIVKAEEFLSRMDLLPDDIENSKTKTKLFSIANGQLSPSTSLSSTQVIRVDLFQKDVDNLPIFYPHSPLSTMNFLVGGGVYESQVIAGNFSYREIDKSFYTYPIKTSAIAFEDLKNEKGYITSFDDKNKDVLIKNVFLAYYLSENQNYLLPIVVFQGDNNFFAYIEAVTDEWIEK